MANWTFRKVEPTGSRTSQAMVCREGGRGELELVTMSTYPPSPRGDRLHDLRVRRNLGLREAATMLGMSATRLSDLQAGRAVLGDESEWNTAEALLTEASR
jgi:LmbE family N-acetylglucosaminyl deacetylase